ncbi:MULTISPECIES: Na+/H+ antiporter NhaA [Thermocrispum]|uniref:Na+/H+ antiporter NhaA n=1 Tax=Thermocrispum TaxID=37924 RepID=UPI0003F927DE|nr:MULTISPECIES: Na+/H+ antiporter NhaA [Thermocrispum]
MPQPRRQTRPIAEFARFLRTETAGGVVLLVAAAIALIWANSGLGDTYTAVRDYTVGPHALHLHLSIGDWAKDGVLTLFFFVVGLELKRELVLGELSSIKDATLPIIAAIGGMVAPAAITLLLSWGEEGFTTAWAVPMATDIAFALGVLAVTAQHLPSGARIFLLSLAVVDDLGGIIVIAVVFTSGIDLAAAAVAAAGLALYWWLQHRRVRSSLLYVPLAVVIWVAVHFTGVHATMAGVAMGLLTRVRPDPGEDEAPALRLEHRLQPYSAMVAVPLFALFAAGVPVDGEALSTMATTPVPLAIAVGLVAGKLIGILGASGLAVATGLARLPARTGWLDIAALAVLGGVGFTVSLLIADLGLPDSLHEPAKAAVLIGSLVASLLAALMLGIRSRAHRRSRAVGEA